MIFLKPKNYLPCMFGSCHRKCNYPHTRCLMLCDLNLGNEHMISISHRRFHSKRALMKYYSFRIFHNKQNYTTSIWSIAVWSENTFFLKYDNYSLCKCWLFQRNRNHHYTKYWTTCRLFLDIDCRLHMFYYHSHS